MHLQRSVGGCASMELARAVATTLNERYALYSELMRARGRLISSFAEAQALPAFWGHASHQASLTPPSLLSKVRPAPRWCLLLTATTNVQVNLTSNKWGRGQQVHSSARKRAYLRALRSWLEHLSAVGMVNELPVIFAENSHDRAFLSYVDAQLKAPNATSFASLPFEARSRVELLDIGPASTCTQGEIGCHEASAVLRAIRASRHFRRGADGSLPRCTHALKVTLRQSPLPPSSELTPLCCPQLRVCPTATPTPLLLLVTLRPSRQVTGRYFVPNITDELRRCSAASLVVQNRAAHLAPEPRQVTSASSLPSPPPLELRLPVRLGTFASSAGDHRTWV